MTFIERKLIMKKADVVLEQTYTCKSLLLSNPFEGKVVNLLDNACIVEIVKTHDDDASTARELQNRTVVSYDDLKEK